MPEQVTFTLTRDEYSLLSQAIVAAMADPQYRNESIQYGLLVLKMARQLPRTQTA